MSLNILLPNFQDRSGHENSFIKVYNEIAKLKNKDITFFVSEDNNLEISNKVTIFKNIRDQALIKKLFIILNNAKKLNFIFKKNINKKNIYIIDGHSLTFVISIILSCFKILKNNDVFMIYYREPFFLNFFKKKIYSLMFNLLKKVFHEVYILTDTKQLKDKIYQVHNFPTHYLPIPHIFKNNLDQQEPSGKLSILLPGQFRKDKGEKNIKKFLYKNKKEDFLIRLNEKFNIPEEKKVEKIKNNLTFEDYKNTFLKSDIIFLPYNHKRYFYSSSGVFIESISLNKFCFVTCNTWMSEIYEKNNLNDLIVLDWGLLQIDDIKRIVKNKNIKENYQKLKKNIISEYNTEEFIKKFQKII